MVDLKSRGCRKLKRGNTDVPVCMSLREVHCCCTAAAAAAAAVYRCCTVRVLLEFRGSVVWNRPACVQDDKHILWQRS